jgi:hypothetical protein
LFGARSDLLLWIISDAVPDPVVHVFAKD